MKNFEQLLGLLGLWALGMLLPICAAAQECPNLDSNPAWNEGLRGMSAAYQAEDYEQALTIGKQLQDICDKSPVLNYMLANIYKTQKNEERYLFFLERATEQTRNFAVDNDLLNRMWSDKYIAAHPEAAPDAIMSKNAVLRKYQFDLELTSQSLKDREYEIQSLKKDLESSGRKLEDNLELYKTLMWTGAGIGIGGLAFAGAGAGMVLSSEPIDFKEKFNAPHQYKEKVLHSLGWAFVGTGAALAVTGAVLTGVYGYRYRHYNDSQEDAELTFSVYPACTSMIVTF